MISRVRSTKDLLDLRLSNFVSDQLKKHLRRYNFIEIQTKVKDSSIPKAYVENSIEQSPWKVYTYGLNENEKGQQKTQFCIESVNIESIVQEALFIKILDSFFHETMLLENYVLKINFIGCQECQPSKTSAEKGNSKLCRRCKKDWDTLQKHLSILYVSFVVDASLNKNQTANSKMIFEFASRDLGAKSKFCAGGHYEFAKQADMPENIHSVVAKIDWENLLKLAEKNQNKLAIPQDPALNLIIPMTTKQHTLAILFANQLHNQGLCVDVLLEKASLENMIKKANKMGAKFALILGEDGQKSGLVTIKNIKTGHEAIVKQVDVIKTLRA